MPCNPARLPTLLLTATYGLIAVMGSGGLHLVGGFSHAVHRECAHDHVTCHAHGLSCVGPDEGDSHENTDSVSFNRSPTNSHDCPICHWFAQCKSQPPAEGVLAVSDCLAEGLHLFQQLVLIQPVPRSSLPRAPPDAVQA